MLLLYISIFFLVAAGILFILTTQQKKRTGLPSGKVIYTDTSRWGKVEKPLFDPALRLTGKPDYLVKQGNQVIPIEVKSRPAPANPYDSHIYQLAAYCLLVGHEYRNRPSQGILHYADRSYAIDFTPALEEKVIDAVRQIQAVKGDDEVNRSHQDGRRCQNCGYRSICDQALRI